ncbi:Suppressor of cytokine signaling 5 [Dissostichus eleginoides]|uniref:Suppressor of cytokine signaling 5 n=1 Tax=Dissostichus eleginoides TaxID=100907 RepID=A0AAD9FLB6_DISEL|nr:Suppressor of cytokine signaling 5 [Dissostichus eleginoides]
MKKVGNMWSNLKSRCQTLFHNNSSGPSESRVEADGVHCVVELGGSSGEAEASGSSSPSRSLLPVPMVTAGRRHHNCVSDIPQIVEITIDKDSEDVRGGSGGVPLPEETHIPVMHHGGARKNTRVPPKPRALWRRTGGPGACGGAGAAGTGAMESAPSRR